MYGFFLNTVVSTCKWIQLQGPVSTIFNENIHIFQQVVLSTQQCFMANSHVTDTYRLKLSCTVMTLLWPYEVHSTAGLDFFKTDLLVQIR